MELPYAYAENSPISNIDLDGLERIYYLDNDDGSRTELYVENFTISSRNQRSSGLDNFPLIQGETVDILNPYQVLINVEDVWAAIDDRRNENFERRDRARNYNRNLAELKSNHSNFIWNAYQLSYLKDGYEVYDAFKNGGFQAAGVTLLFVALPEGLEQLGKGLKIGLKNADEFYESTAKLGSNERVARYREAANDFASQNNLIVDKVWSKKAGRKFYKGSDGTRYGVDTAHGHLEVHNSKGKHQGSIDFSGTINKNRNPNYDLKL